MSPLSIGKAWEDSVAFVKREGHLLFPVAFLFLAVPTAVWPYLIPPEWESWKPDGTGRLPAVPPSMIMGFVGMMLVSTFGALALFSLALRPGISVGEALRMGFARLPVQVGAISAIIGGFMLAGLAGALVLGVIAVASKPLGLLVGVVLMFAALVGGIYAGVRLTLLNPVVLDGNSGPIASIRKAWALSQGHFWQLLGFLLLIVLVTLIASTAAQAVFGSIAGLIGGTASGLLIGGLASSIVSAVANVYIVVMLARIYRQLEPRDLGEVFS